jgi:type IV secretory pathway VirB10-like protein
MEALKKIFLKESIPFVKKREVNKSAILRVCITGISLVVVGVLFIPSPKLEQTNFHEKVDRSGVVREQGKDNDPTNQTIQELKDSQASLRSLPKPGLGAPSSGGSLGNGSSSTGRGADLNTPMILSRDGSDSSNSLTAGTRVSIFLSQSLTIANESMPVTGVVSADVIANNSLAIPEGTKVIGEANFDESSSRANLVWKTLILADGRERPFSAISIGSDNQVGIVGNVKSNALKNTLGQALTQFVGAYAQGSMSSGMFGASDGGVQNGLKSAVAQTAKERANSFGESMKKEHQWIELSAGTSLLAILSQSFVYRDPGSTNGR